MQNVVSLRFERPRPPRASAAPCGGARILFFTGVRYCRDEGPGEAAPALLRPAAERLLDAAAH